MSVEKRVTRLEHMLGGSESAIVRYDHEVAPQDPEEMAAFLEELRPPGAAAVVFVAIADNGRDPAVTSELERIRRR